MTQKDNNTVAGYHFQIVDGEMIINKKKVYKWHIPKRLRWTNIQRGDIVEVLGAKKPKTKIIVLSAFREDIEDTGVSHAPVVYVNKPIGRYLDRKRKRVNYYGKN